MLVNPQEADMAERVCAKLFKYIKITLNSI